MTRNIKTVMTILILIAFFACKKKESDIPSHTNEINGSHFWHGLSTNHISPDSSTQSTVTLTFPITVINDQQILSGYDNTTLTLSSSNDTALIFEGMGTPIAYYNIPLTIVTYDYIKKTIYFYYSTGSFGQELDLTTP